MLALGKQEFIQKLTALYNDVKMPKTHPDYANRECDLIHAFIIKATPMTTITTNGGGVGGYQTAGPVRGKGLGGIDKRSPSMGLDSGKNILEQDLNNIYTHRDTLYSAADRAQKVVDAIEKYIKSAIVRTNDLTSGPLPAPAPAGPVQGPIRGIGGVKTDRPGTGYNAAKPKFKSDLNNIYKAIDREISSAQKAKEISQAIHDFTIQGIVKINGTFVAGASVSTESGSGSYQQGTGQSIKATLS
jgi:hypothetical protein